MNLQPWLRYYLENKLDDLIEEFTKDFNELPLDGPLHVRQTYATRLFHLKDVRKQLKG